MKTAEELIKDKEQKILSVTPDTSIRETLKVMAKNKIGSILVKENGKILGIWTERDLLHNVLEDDFNLDSSKISDFMVTDLHYAKHTDSAYILMDKFLGLRFRHMLIEKDGDFLGMLSMGDVVKQSLREKFEDLKKENKNASWEYYEEWKWVPHD